MSKKRRRARSHLQTEGEPKAVRVLEYEITTSPMQDRRYRRLPRQIKDAIDRLHHYAQLRPRRAIPELLDLLDRYPRIPVLYNYLSVAYSASGQNEKAEAVARENYRRHPDYLFARLNYAELCLGKGEYEQAAQILEHKFDLKLLYPKRKRFHISEVVNFMGVVGTYFVETGQRETARRYYDVLREIAPDYPMTVRLRRKLFPGPLRRLLLRLLGRA